MTQYWFAVLALFFFVDKLAFSEVPRARQTPDAPRTHRPESSNSGGTRSNRRKRVEKPKTAGPAKPAVAQASKLRGKKPVEPAVAEASQQRGKVTKITKKATPPPAPAVAQESSDRPFSSDSYQQAWDTTDGICDNLPPKSGGQSAGNRVRDFCQLYDQNPMEKDDAFSGSMVGVCAARETSELAFKKGKMNGEALLSVPWKMKQPVKMTLSSSMVPTGYDANGDLIGEIQRRIEREDLTKSPVRFNSDEKVLASSSKTIFEKADWKLKSFIRESQKIRFGTSPKGTKFAVTQRSYLSRSFSKGRLSNMIYKQEICLWNPAH